MDCLVPFQAAPTSACSAPNFSKRHRHYQRRPINRRSSSLSCRRTQTLHRFFPILLKLKQAFTAYKEAQDSTPAAAFERLIATYDVAINTAINKDRELALQVVTMLEKTLRADINPEITLSLLGIYSDCRTALKNEEWAHFAEMIEQLKGLWTAKFRLEQATIAR